MKKRIAILVLLSMSMPVRSIAQEYGNEWINFSQRYYKLYTAQDGIYRITYNELVTVGVPISTIDPRNIQIFHRGKEQAIFVKDQNDARFDPEDYIDFYGKKNDGTLDEELYVSPEAQPHKYYNFYSDTTAYFLTWSLSERGKRISDFNESNILNLPAEPYHLNEQLILQTNVYATGLRYPVGGDVADTYLSAFDYGEGWTGTFFPKGQYRDVLFTGLTGVVTSGPRPILEVLVTGGNNRSHEISVAVGPDQGSLRDIGNISFNYLYDTLVTDTLEWSDFAGDELVCRVSILDRGVADRVAISYAKLKFADNWDQEFLEQKNYYLPGTNSNRSYIKIINVPLGVKLFDLTNENDIVEIGYNRSGNDIDAVVPNGTDGRKLMLVSGRIQVPKIEPIDMRNFSGSKANYLIITNKVLRKPSLNYPDVPRAYAAYRASAIGGNFDTLLVNVDQLYNIFSYGEYTSLAVYRFCDYMASSGNPSHLFIIGKGVSGFYMKESATGDLRLSKRDLVPTAGYPGSDVLYTVGLNGSTHEAGFPVGRLSAETPNEVEAYFEKVKEMERTPHDALWRKELVHLSGGRTSFEQNLFRRYVDGFKSIAENEMLGGDVTTVSKKTNGATELINIAEEVNSGKMLITFFGHSGATGTDIDIGNVSEIGFGYVNKGKYPMLLINGCNAGDMFRNNLLKGFGEDWILTPDKGSVGFMAHTNNGITSYLRRYTNIFYEVAFTDSMYLNKGIGEIQKGIGKKYLEDLGPAPNEIDISQIQQMALHGDPAVALFGVKKPDFDIISDHVFVESEDGSPVNAFTEIFNLGLIVRNFGSTVNDSLKVSVTRRLSNGVEINFDTISFNAVFHKDTIYFPIKSEGIDGFGLNQFTISIDPSAEIDELNETNNQTVFEFFMPLGGTYNIVPYNYAITNQKDVRLIAQSLDVLMEGRTYRFELDTTKRFNSPVRQQTVIQGNSLAKWTVNLFSALPETDTLVFYWRTKFANPRPDELDMWNTSSFTYVKDGHPGWAMTHFQQIEENTLHNLIVNQAAQLLEFEKFETSVRVRTFGKFHEEFDHEHVELLINNQGYIFPTRLCTTNSMNFVAFDESNTIPYLVLGQPSVLDRRNCGRSPSVINNMLNTEIELNLMIEQYINAMEEGDFVVLFSIGNVTFSNWPSTTLAKLEEIGVNTSAIENLQDGEPLIILGKKGINPGAATIVTADYSNPTPATQQEILLEEIIIGQSATGTLTSPRIGPASSWISFHQRNSQLEPSSDQYSFDIYGIDDLNKANLLYQNVQSSETDLQGLSATQYPFLKIRMHTADEIDLTPTQLRNWFVIYDGVPEGILSFKSGQTKTGIEINEGNVHSASYIFENISDLDFGDSIAVEYNLFNRTTRNSFIDTILVKPLKSGELVEFTINVETLGKSGTNDLKTFANPYILKEQNFNNNFINLPEHLSIISDNINPILEVTVDGEFIMDGDIVSPSPMINLRMKDENGILFKQDTLGINLYLNEKCESCSPTRISFSSPELVWTPATEENDFTVEYQPQNLKDGIYTLKAEASDASGNLSGSEPYAVNFEVVNESQITNFFPYPNPFSTRTQFVFTLTGSEVPEEIIIQIMTVNGTVVREITQDEIGPIKIGHNKTEYAWDGRDEYGDQLANGVYLYKVKIYTNGKEMKHRRTSADKAFKHGVGKLYLLK
ncbi:MAG: C25 family cysteine peptidase [Cytophagales bacterium]|nr:C25 family cysteine peptidase [Cytophagales bacterium]